MPFNLLDGKWVGRATLDFASQEFADCPPIVDFDVAIRGRKVEGAVRPRTDGGPIYGSVVSEGQAHGIDATILLHGWAEHPSALVGSYANGEIRGELEAIGFCIWTMTLKKAE